MRCLSLPYSLPPLSLSLFLLLGEAFTESLSKTIMEEEIWVEREREFRESISGDDESRRKSEATRVHYSVPRLDVLVD